MNPNNLPENPTKGVVRRTLRGMDGRISHIETVAAAWSPAKVSAAVAAALAPFQAAVEEMSRYLDKAAGTIRALSERIAALTPAPMPQPPAAVADVEVAKAAD